MAEGQSGSGQGATSSGQSQWASSGAGPPSYLKRKYGITPEQYDEMLASQHGGCAICGRPPTPGISLHVDHDHETGAIRRLLCFLCKNLLGDANDDPSLLEKAAAYLHSYDPVVQEDRRLAKARVGSLLPPEPTLF